MRYYIDNPNDKTKHIYLETEHSIKWIATVTDDLLAMWLVHQLNTNQISEMKPAAANKEEEFQEQCLEKVIN